MATTADIKNGLVIEMDNQLYTIVEFLHVKPGKGGAFVRTKLKQVVTGRVIERTLRSGEKIDIIRLEARELQYLYKDGDDFVFMDQTTYDQIPISQETLGDSALFVREGDMVKVAFHGEKPLTVEIPNFLNLKIVQCEPGAKGDTVSNVTKPAVLETGAVVQVPLFVEEGEIIKVDTRTKTYLERVRD